MVCALFRSGSRRNNWELYPNALHELGRVCRPLTSRAILLTHDNKALSAVRRYFLRRTVMFRSAALLSIDSSVKNFQALQKNSLWKRHQTRWISVGGLTAAVYILYRSKQNCLSS